MQERIKKESQGEYYIKENGKKIKLNFDINSIVTDQLFEVPAHLFTIMDTTVVNG